MFDPLIEYFTRTSTLKTMQTSRCQTACAGMCSQSLFQSVLNATAGIYNFFNLNFSCHYCWKLLPSVVLAQQKQSVVDYVLRRIRLFSQFDKSLFFFSSKISCLCHCMCYIMWMHYQFRVQFFLFIIYRVIYDWKRKIIIFL